MRKGFGCPSSSAGFSPETRRPPCFALPPSTRLHQGICRQQLPTAVSAAGWFRAPPTLFPLKLTPIAPTRKGKGPIVQSPGTILCSSLSSLPEPSQALSIRPAISLLGLRSRHLNLSFVPSCHVLHRISEVRGSSLTPHRALPYLRLNLVEQTVPRLPWLERVPLHLSCLYSKPNTPAKRSIKCSSVPPAATKQPLHLECAIKSVKHDACCTPKSLTTEISIALLSRTPFPGEFAPEVATVS